MQPVSQRYPVGSQVARGDDSAETVEPAALRATASESRPRTKRRWKLSTCLLAAIVVFAVTTALEFALATLSAPRVAFAAIGLPGFGACVVLAILGLVRGVASWAENPPGTLGIMGLISGIVFAAGAVMMSLLGAFSAWLATVGFSRGRQLRKCGRVLLPPVCAGDAWVDSGVRLEGGARVPAGLADRWRANGRTEHASVASFARLSLDLMALGAPPALIAAANRDALDEIRHARACFALAYALDGKAESPGPFPGAQTARTLPRSRRFALATLAVTSLVDGALHEGVSARIIAKLARRCEEPAIQKILEQIAADEGRHAAHGWHVVEWCLQVGGAPVAFALLGALRTLPDHMRSELPDGAANGAWECWGIHGRALESEAYAAARRHLLARVRARVAPLLREGASREARARAA
jgi:hypothetical protein